MTQRSNFRPNQPLIEFLGIEGLDEGMTTEENPMITTAEAAEQLGIDVAKFHRLVAKHNMDPLRKLPGVRGAMLWDARVIEALRTEATS